MASVGRGMHSPRVVVAGFLALALMGAGCSDDDLALDVGSDEGAVFAEPDPGVPLYEVTAMVVEIAGQGPLLCLGPQTLALTSPPSCAGGAQLVGWEWGAVDDEIAQDGARSGLYRVVGTYEGDVFTLAEPAEPAPHHPMGSVPPSPPAEPNTPCPEPGGGWRVVDPATATEAGQQAAMAYAQAQPDYGGFWGDQSLNPVLADGFQPGEESMWVTDYTKFILNVSFTGDLERHEADLREVWGGPLCVSRASRSWTEVTRIAGELMHRPGIMSTAPDGVTGTVRVGVIVDDGLQERMDAEFGQGAVVVEPQLRRID